MAEATGTQVRNELRAGGSGQGYKHCWAAHGCPLRPAGEAYGSSEGMLIRSVVLSVAAWALSALAHAATITQPERGRIIDSPSGTCAARIGEFPGTGALVAVLVRKGRQQRKIIDVGELVWQGETLVYTVGPIYGKPGIYAWECKTGRTRVLVRAANQSRYYPEGADFFRLVRLDGDLLEYEHAANVDSKSLDEDLAQSRRVLRLPRR